MDISIITVNYNTTEHLEKCIDSIILNKPDLNLEIIVIDNNSPDRAIEKLPQLFPQVKFYLNDENKGFGNGCNYGASKAKGKYFAFVNPDITITSDVLSPIFRFMENNPEAGACSPLLYDFTGEPAYIYNDFPNIRWEFNEALGSGNDKVVEKKISEIYDIKKNEMEIDWATGAFLIVNAELFNILNGFDDDYFLYYEDTDLEKRINNAGFKIFLLKDQCVRHFSNSSIRTENGENVYFFHINRSKMLYYYKNTEFLMRNTVRIIHIVGIIFRIALLPFRKRFIKNRSRKMNQYKQMLIIYFSVYKKLLSLKFR